MQQCSQGAGGTPGLMWPLSYRLMGPSAVSSDTIRLDEAAYAG